jgi:hypothetical protein
VPSQFRVGQRIDASEATEHALGDGSVLRLDKGTSLNVDRCPSGETTAFEVLTGRIWSRSWTPTTRTATCMRIPLA